MSIVENEIRRRTELVSTELAETRQAVKQRDEKVIKELNNLKGKMWTTECHYWRDVEKIIKLLEE